MGAARTLSRGIAALAVLAVLTLGVPWLLLRIAGSPIPDAIPTWDQIWTSLTSRDDGTLLLALLKYAAWAGWGLFAASLAADVIARVRGISVPRLGPQQHLASGLVSAVVAIAVTIPATGPAAASRASGPQQTISTTAAAAPAPHPGVEVSWRAALAATPGRSGLVQTDHYQASRFEQYTVRKGDCLWDIAWNELGDPERWPELWHASRHLRQPGGRRISDPDHIEPGWTILIPATRTSAAADPAPHLHTPTRRAVPRVTTPLDPAAAATGGKGRDRPPVTTPLSVNPAEGAHEQVSSAQDGALDAWATAVLRQEAPLEQRGAWRARISGPTRTVI